MVTHIDTQESLTLKCKLASELSKVFHTITTNQLFPKLNSLSQEDIQSILDETEQLRMECEANLKIERKCNADRRYLVEYLINKSINAEVHKIAHRMLCDATFLMNSTHAKIERDREKIKSIINTYSN